MKTYDEQNGVNELDHHLLQQIEAILAHPDAPNAESESLPSFAAHLAGTAPQADELFREALEARLVAQLSRRKGASTGRKVRARWASLVTMTRSLKLGAAASLVLLLSLAIAWPVLGRTPLQRVAPREVTALPAITNPTFEPAPTAPRWTEMEELEKAVGFSLFVPTWLPSGCVERERFSISPGAWASLVYSCVAILEQKGESVQRPYVGEGSVEEVTIAGQPALYVDGAWFTIVKNGSQEGPVWKPGIQKQLIFERNGVVILVRGLASLTKDDLFAIAESMQRR